MVKMIQDKRNESAGYSKWIKCDENAEEEEEAEAEEEKQQRQTKLGFCIFFCLRIHYACMLGVLGVCVCVRYGSWQSAQNKIQAPESYLVDFICANGAHLCGFLFDAAKFSENLETKIEHDVPCQGSGKLRPTVIS